MSKMCKVQLKCLITSVGLYTTPGTLRMLRENPDGEKVVAYGIDADPRVYSKGLVDHFFCVPLRESPDYLPAILELCKRERIDLILFQTDVEALICARHREEFEQIGTHLLCADIGVLERATDKGRLYENLQGVGIPIPDHRLVTDKTCEKAAYAMGYPDRELVAKPPDSAGARGVYHITEKPLPWDTRLRIPMVTLAQLTRSLDRPILLVEALPGPEYSVDAFLGEKTSVAIPRRRDQIVGGLATQTTLEYRPDLADFTLKAGKALGLRYLYGMQFRCDDAGNPKLLECNPRIQGSSIASLFSGVNLLWMAVQERLGTQPQTAPTPTHGATFARSWEGVVLRGED